MPQFRPGSIIVALALLFFLAATSSALRRGASPMPEYRNISGYGNNKAHPEWGTATQPLPRIQMPSAYGGSGDGSVLARATGPSARTVSNVVLSATKRLSPLYDNLMHTYFGQVISLDMVHVMKGTTEKDDMRVPSGDPWKDPTSTGNVTLPFTRSAFSMVNGIREQYNELTAWLDMSWLYSPSSATLAKQRAGAAGKGQLRLNIFHDPPFPTVWNAGKWLLGGQDEINKTPALHAWFNLFGQYHNKVAAEYAQMHPDWDDETVFQEARAWTIAVYQNIASRKYLAATVGKALPPYSANTYNASANPNVDNFFAAVSFRYGHAVTTAVLPRLDDELDESTDGSLLVRDTLYNPTTYYVPDKVHGIWNDNGILKGCPHASILRGVANSLAGRSEASVVDDLRNFMFGKEDLASLNIQRARDHASYNDAREYFGLKRVTKWSDISTDVPTQQRLAAAYATVDDIDPWVGGIAEDTAPSAIVGPLFQASIHEQFCRSRDGDRFWYENPEMFTPEEIAEIHGIGIIELIRMIYPDDVQGTLSFPAQPFFVNKRQLNSTILIRACSYDEVPAVFKDNLMQLAPLVQFSWAVDSESKTVTLLIQACIEGWVGIGFDPEPNSMKGADIILCRYFSDRNEHECSDRYALDVGVPALDTDIGGTDDIIHSNVSLNAAGVRRYMIVRKLNTEDAYDKVLGTQLTKLIFAFNPHTIDLAYHGPTRSPDNKIAIVTSPLPLSTGLIAFGGAISVLGALVSLFVLVIVITQPDYFKYQSPIFCILILVGTLLGHALVWTFLAEFTDASCTINVWLINLAYVVVFANLFLKTWRMWRVVGNKTLKVTIVTVGDVMKMVLLFLSLELVVLVVWTAVDRPRALVVRDHSFGVLLNTYHLICKHPYGVFWYISIAYKAAQMMFGVFLTVKTRSLPPIFNDSRQVGISIYIATFTLVVLIPVSVILEWSVEATYATRVIGASVPFTLITLILFGGNILRFLKGKPPVKFSRRVSISSDGSTSSGGGQTTSSSPTTALSPIVTPTVQARRLSKKEIQSMTGDMDNSSDEDTGSDTEDSSRKYLSSRGSISSKSSATSPQKKKKQKKKATSNKKKPAAETTEDDVELKHQVSPDGSDSANSDKPAVKQASKKKPLQKKDPMSGAQPEAAKPAPQKQKRRPVSSSSSSPDSE